MVLPTLTGMPITREATEACADVGGPSSVHTLSALRNVTIVRACLATVYDVLNSCKLDVQEKNEFYSAKSEAHSKFIGREEQLWKHTEEKGNKETELFVLGVGIFFAKLSFFTGVKSY